MQISSLEIQELSQLEITIERGLQTFYEVGTALAAIRDKRLYRADYDTFEAYCQERWNMTHRYSNNLIAAADVVNNLGTVVPKNELPTAERQARPLSPLPPIQQVQAWQRAVEIAPNNKPTAAIVQQAVDEIIAPKSMPHVSFNSGENDWYTPLEFILAAKRVMGTIDLDPASSELANKTVIATRFYTQETNGLDKEWRGKVWLNPPYSSDLITPFVEKYAASIRAKTVTEGIVLVNNATETAWFYKLVEVSNAVLFTRSRIKFIDKQGNRTGAPLQGQALLYHGKQSELFLTEFAALGWGALL